jgi:hypothetical protein
MSKQSSKKEYEGGKNMFCFVVFLSVSFAFLFTDFTFILSCRLIGNNTSYPLPVSLCQFKNPCCHDVIRHERIVFSSI